MTRASRGISPIQRKARGNKMAKKSGMPTLPKKESMKAKITKRGPGLDSMSVGAAGAPMPPAAGLRAAMPGMKKGGSCKGYAKGGSIDGVAKKGRTRGKIC